MPTETTTMYEFPEPYDIAMHDISQAIAHLTITRRRVLALPDDHPGRHLAAAELEQARKHVEGAQAVLVRGRHLAGGRPSPVVTLGQKGGQSSE